VEATLDRLRVVCRTRNDVLLFTSSGSAAFESAVVNLLSPGERALAVMAGEFGERWAALATAYGVEVHELRYAWGETPRADDVRSRLEETGAKVAFVVHVPAAAGDTNPKR
jgi:aspartate aminotransferase-like enzyme